MKKFLVLFTVLAAAIFAISATRDTNPDNTVVLTDSNTVVLRNVIDEANVAQTESKLLEMSQKLPSSATIYLVLDTPGGSVFDGLQLIEFAKSLPQEVKTVTNFAASMGFITAQALGERLVRPFGVLMSHRAKGGAEGQTPGELEVRSAFWTRMLMKIDELSAKRMGLTVEQLRAKHHDEYWTFGQEAVSDHAADKVVTVKCDKSLNGTEKSSVQTFFGPVAVTYSKCPLIAAPLSVDFQKIKKDISKADYDNLVTYINTLLYDRRDFVENYISNNKFYEFTK